MRPSYRPYYACCPPVCPVRARNSKTKKCRKGVDVLHGTSNWNANFQFKRSKVKVPGRKNLQSLASSLLMSSLLTASLDLPALRDRRQLHTTPLLVLLYYRRLRPWATGRKAACNVGANISRLILRFL